MSVINRIMEVGASYRGGSFLLDDVIPAVAGDKLWILTKGIYPVEVLSLAEAKLLVSGQIPIFDEGERLIVGYSTKLKTPQSLQWDIADLEASSGSGMNQMGRSFRDRIGVKRTLACSWSALSDDEMSQLLNMMQDVFFYLEYPDALTGEKKVGEFYVGNRSTPMLMQREDGSWMWQSLSATFTER